MQADNAFDRTLEINRDRIPADVRDAAIFIVDTLDLAWKGAQAVFENEAKPEHAISILGAVLDRLRQS